MLEPSVGEGAFLINILDRRLILIAERFPDDLIRFENYALWRFPRFMVLNFWKTTSKMHNESLPHFS